MRLIDADEALKKVDEAFMQYVEHDDILRMYSDARVAVIFAPTIEAEPVRHGRWIEDGDCQICSECGEEHSWIDYRASFCEDCGAKMDGEQK